MTHQGSRTVIKAGNMGCSLHPDCFTCPFPDCREDLVNGEQSIRVQVLAQKATWLRRQGLRWGMIARQLGVSEVTLRYARKKYGLDDDCQEGGGAQ